MDATAASAHPWPHLRQGFAPLVEELREIAAGGPLLYLPNRGNWGAALTRAATLQFFADAAIQVREVDRLGLGRLLRARLGGWSLAYGGGGAWAPPFDGGHRAVGRAAPWMRRTVVLPSWYGRPVTAPRCSFWARDRHGSLAEVPAARFCHDLGFWLGPQPAGPPRVERGGFFRDDALAVGGARAPDLSGSGTERSPLGPFLDRIAAAAEVHTDRIHVAIAACLLGRPCHVYATRNPMMLDLFRSSIEPFFSRARFHDRPPEWLRGQ